MKKVLVICFALVLVVGALGCEESYKQAKREAQRVGEQQSQYSTAQPIPAFDWSLERHLVIELYKLRNRKVATHAVWRSDYGLIEGDCPSMGYGIPYDTSLTNPLTPAWYHAGAPTIEQAEPNGIFASKNTAATWVFCVGQGGKLEPIYIESKVTIYPGPVKVDYATNRVIRSGAATVMIPSK